MLPETRPRHGESSPALQSPAVGFRRLPSSRTRRLPVSASLRAACAMHCCLRMVHAPRAVRFAAERLREPMSPAILYVDDDAPNLDLFTRWFDEQFTVLTAPSGPQALEL